MEGVKRRIVQRRTENQTKSKSCKKTLILITEQSVHVIGLCSILRRPESSEVTHLERGQCKPGSGNKEGKGKGGRDGWEGKDKLT